MTAVWARHRSGGVPFRNPLAGDDTMSRMNRPRIFVDSDYDKLFYA